MSNNLNQVIKAYIQEEFLFDRPGTAIADDTPLIDEGIIDSLGIFTMVIFLKEQFGTEVEPDELVLENFESINAISRLVQSKRTG